MTTENTTPITLESLNAYFRGHNSFAAALDISITEFSEDHAVTMMPLTDSHRNGMGSAHGGAIFSVADVAFAAAALVHGNVFVSANSSISYLAPGRKGPLRAEARKVRFGRTLGVYEVRITDATDTLLAICTITGCSTHVPLSEVERIREKMLR